MAISPHRQIAFSCAFLTVLAELKRRVTRLCLVTRCPPGSACFQRSAADEQQAFGRRRASKTVRSKAEPRNEKLNPRQFARSIALFIAFGLLQAGVRAQQPAATSKDSSSAGSASTSNQTVRPPEGFRSLFNGKDLSGWTGAIDDYEVVDGCINCKPGKGGVLFTKEEFKDFVVQVDFLVPPGGNNGLAIRYPGKGRASYDAMCELQVLDDDAPKYKDLDARQYHGSIYGIVAAKRGALKPAGQWNSQTVTVVGSTIKVELNGQVIVDADVSKVETYLHDLPHPGKMLTQGHFGFAGHNDPVKFRNIFIKDLK